MLISNENKLPTELTNALNDTKQLRCRFAWKILDTGYMSHGEWHDLSQEDMLKDHIKDANRRYAGEIHHWIQYD